MSRIAAAVGAAAMALAIGALPGCGSTCGANCPVLLFDVEATLGDNLDLATAQWTGPACPAQQPGYCMPDVINSVPCVRLTIVGTQPGTCQLDLTFNDERAPFSATAEFGPETHQGCCHGFPVVGPTFITVPPLHPKPGDAGVDGASVDAADAVRDTSAEVDSGNG